MLAGLLPGLSNLQNVHPLVIHFPIALLSVAVASYLSGWLLRREPLVRLGLWTLALGALSALVAAGTGLYAQGGVMVATSVRDALLDVHRDWMLVTTGLSVVAALWALGARPMPARGRPLFMLLLLVMLAVMIRGADYGGRLVYDYNAGGQACGQPIEFTH